MFVDPSHPEKIEKRIRDGEGKFVSKDTPVEETATKTAESSGPINVIKTALADPSIDKPLLNVTINNPFRKILQWIKEIKNKQTTTFEFKVKVPLIALPVFLFVLGSAFTFFFNLGKAAEKQNVNNIPTPAPISTIVPTTNPSPYIISKVGIIKGTYQTLGIMAQADITQSPVPTNTPIPTSTPTPTPPLSRFVLLDKDEKITFLIAEDNIALGKYLNRRVLVTGLYNLSNESLTIQRLKDIEILP